MLWKRQRREEEVRVVPRIEVKARSLESREKLTSLMVAEVSPRSRV
jgi:hypothetical protein